MWVFPWGEALEEAPRVCFLHGKSPNSLNVRLSHRQVKDDTIHSGGDLLPVYLRIQVNQISRG